MNAKLRILSAILVVVTAQNAFADRRMNELTEGMNYNQVLRVLGEPTEKIDKETKREDVWLYGLNELVFAEGKLVAWKEAGTKKAIGANPANLGADAQDGVSGEDVALEDILTDIVSETKEEDKKARRRKRK